MKSQPLIGYDANDNLDKQLTRITRPDGQAIELNYNDGAQLEAVDIDRGTYSYGYHSTSGQLDNITAPDNSQLSYTYDGFLLLSETLSGDINGSVSRSYDNNFWATTECVNDAHCVNLSWDNDGLPTGIGDLILTRHPAHGLLTGTQLAGLDTHWHYNLFGEPLGYQAIQAATTLADFTYQRDSLGRITERTEQANGSSFSDSYAYDDGGRLVSVTRNGIATSWQYDDNGNRTHENGVAIATYDDQDRLLTYGNTSYSYTANGELLSKTQSGATTQFDYDEFSNLVAVTLPGDIDIEYLIDGRNRRVGKRVNGDLVQGFLYGDQLNPVAELDGNSEVVSRFVYGTKINVPDTMIRNGQTYRIISDHLGSPRLVVDIQTGVVVQQIEYDVWGTIVLDTNPGFQPFGFAGGIYDHHTGLTRFGARDYDAHTGRWTTKDPIGFWGGAANLYGYVSGNPVNSIDLLGLWEISLQGYLGVGGGVIISYSNGTLEIVGRVGVGVGLDLSYDPYGGPSDHSDKCGSGYIMRGSGRASLGLQGGPFSVGASVHASAGNAVTHNHGGGFVDGSPLSISTDGTFGFGLKAGGSIGGGNR